MNAALFDHKISSFFRASTRRNLLRGLGAAVALAATGSSGATEARKRKRKDKKKRNKPPQLNEFGCLDVGQNCRGRGDLCCSGICAGKKPKKGEKDNSECVAHNTGGCTPAENSCGEANPNIPCGAGGFCLLTTGNAPFCGLPEFGQGACAACRADTDCESSFGEGAACVRCATLGCPESGDRACIRAGA